MGLLSLLVVLAACSGSEEVSGPADIETTTVIVDVPDATPEQVDAAAEVIRARLSALDLRTAKLVPDGETLEITVPAVDEDLVRIAVRQFGQLEFRPVLSTAGQTLEGGERVEAEAKVEELRTALSVPAGVTAQQVATDEQVQQASTTTTTTVAPEEGATTTTTLPAPLNQFGVDTNDERFFELFQLENQLSAELTPPEEQTPEGEVTLAGEGGTMYTLGPVALTGEAVSGATAGLGNGGLWTVNPSFKEGADGIDQFNAIAAQCYNGEPTCPALSGEGRGLLGIILDDVVLSAPSINVASFSRDEIQISGQFDETSARALAAALSGGAANVPWTVRD
jgi:preprotein translocase subunit SecD